MALNCDILCHLMQSFIYTSCVRESVALLSMHVSSFIVTQLIYGLHYAAAAAHIKYLKTIILLSWAKGSAGRRWKTKNEQRRIEFGSRHFINLNDANCIFIFIYVLVCASAHAIVWGLLTFERFTLLTWVRLVSKTDRVRCALSSNLSRQPTTVYFIEIEYTFVIAIDKRRWCDDMHNGFVRLLHGVLVRAIRHQYAILL